MSSIDNIKNQNNINLNNFVQGKRSIYTLNEQRGFQTQGNVGKIISHYENFLKNIYDGIITNSKNETSNSHVTFNTSSISNNNSNGDNELKSELYGVNPVNKYGFVYDCGMP